MLTLTLKQNEKITLVDKQGRYLGTVRLKTLRRNQARLEFDVQDDIILTRDALTCDCEEFDHPHPVWWCDESKTPC